MATEVPCLAVCSTVTAGAHSPPGFTTLGLHSPSSSHYGRKGVPYRPKSMEAFRRHSTDGLCPESHPSHGDARGRAFHPYCRQYSEGNTTSSGPPHCPSPPFSCLQELGMGDQGNPVPSPAAGHEEMPGTWPVHSSMLMASPEDASRYSSLSQAAYGSISALQQFPDVFTRGEHVQSSHYCHDRVSSKTSQLDTTEMLYPKPIYSYSILIFMALRSSKTGSLPVSEIYSFMTEHFPYFKTAPDGWKNSVRHNLSLNKCFEKVDNKSGNASRKGCLWALNPAKVEKMQEELQKWRRKDPLTIRKSMARPDELDHIMEDKCDKMKSMSGRLNHHRQPSSSSYPVVRPQGYDTASPYAPPQHREHHKPSQPPSLLYHNNNNNYSPSVTNHRSPYLPSPTTTTTTSSPFPFHVPVTQQPCTILPSNTGGLESPLPAQTPPSYIAALQATRGGVSRSMQELLLEGDLGTDVDMLNPSLIDLQLHGHLWEELKDDSLAPDPASAAAAITTMTSHDGSSPCSSLPSPGPRQRAEGLRTLSLSSGSGGDQEGLFDRSVTTMTHYSGTFANMDATSMSGYHQAACGGVGVGGDASILLM